MRTGQIIITGGSRGIGAAIAKTLSSRGADVVCLSRSGGAPAGRGMVCDITDDNAIKESIARIAEAGPIIGLVNNAGIHEEGPTADLSSADFERLLRINTTSALAMSREAYPHLRAAGGGRILMMGSFFDKMGVAGNVAYCASKAAVAAIGRCLAVEWSADNIQVLTIAPGYIKTDLNRDFLEAPKVARWMERACPVGRPGSPDEIARLAAALLAEEIPFLTGETIYVDGAQAISK